MKQATAAQRAKPGPQLDWQRQNGGWHLLLAGNWTTVRLRRQDWWPPVPPEIAGAVVAVDFDGSMQLDSNGALAMHALIESVEAIAADVQLMAPPAHLLSIRCVLRSAPAMPELPTDRHWGEVVVVLGQSTIEMAKVSISLLSFMGAVTAAVARSLLRPHRLPATAIVRHMEKAGVMALPIVGLLSFLIGVVTAYQGADQLARFGAEIFTVNVVGIGVLREMGALIAAIVVAGRSASAFAAQIGTMKINEEVDALEVIGIDPIQVLVMPRVLGLLLIFPFLVVFSDALGIFGGAVMASVALDISLSQFVAQFRATVPLDQFWIGLSKAPLFATAIAGIGCYQGLLVDKGAAAVGERTTAAVVQAIFLVIVIDAVMSVVFSLIGV